MGLNDYWIPQNTEINTAGNEFRPAGYYNPHPSATILLFSSDRTGGKGGYYLYLVPF